MSDGADDMETALEPNPRECEPIDGADERSDVIGNRSSPLAEGDPDLDVLEWINGLVERSARHPDEFEEDDGFVIS